jgi:hypothetical protein
VVEKGNHYLKIFLIYAETILIILILVWTQLQTLQDYLFWVLICLILISLPLAWFRYIYQQSAMLLDDNYVSWDPLGSYMRSPLMKDSTTILLFLAIFVVFFIGASLFFRVATFQSFLYSLFDQLKSPVFLYLIPILGGVFITIMYYLFRLKE